MRILKFGGKSLADKEKVKGICEYIREIYKKDKQLIIVVSAQGKTTDNLIAIANEYSGENINKRELDVLLSTGETMSSALFVMMLNKLNIPAKSFQGFQLEISTFGDFGNSKIAYINKSLLNDCIQKNIVAVVSGFQGINKLSEITTLGRGGSDTTASAIGAIYEKNVEIYSDFDGIFSGDPKIFDYKKIKKIDYNSMITLAEDGAKVMDEKATILAQKFNFKIFAKSAKQPKLLGTEISNVENDSVAIAFQDNLCEISIIFSNPARLKKISKIIVSVLSEYNFYNLNIKHNEIKFIINNENKNNVMYKLSKMLNLLK